MVIKNTKATKKFTSANKISKFYKLTKKSMNNCYITLVPKFTNPYIKKTIMEQGKKSSIKKTSLI